MNGTDRDRSDVPVDGAGPYSIGSNDWPGISKLIEECGEVMQVAGKLLGTGGNVAHWDGSDLGLRLEEELADLLAAAQFVIETVPMHAKGIEARRVHKLYLFRKWHREQEGH